MRCAHFFLRNVTDFVDTPHGDADSVSLRVILLRDSHCLNAAKNRPSGQVHHLKQGAVKREGAAIGKAELPQQGRTVHGPQTQGALRFTRSGFHTTPSRRDGVCKGRERGQGEHAALECRAP